MGFLIRSLNKQQASVGKWFAHRCYTSDVTARAMVFSDYGQPSKVLK